MKLNDQSDIGQCLRVLKILLKTQSVHSLFSVQCSAESVSQSMQVMQVCGNL